MIKLLTLMFILIISKPSFAAESVNTVLLNNDFSPDSIQSLFNKYPELTTFQVAKVLPLVNDDAQFILKIYDENSRNAFLIIDELDEISVEKIEVEYRIENKNFVGIIHRNLYDSIFDELENSKVANTIADAFKDDIVSTKGLKIEASYSFEIESYFDNDQFIKFGNVLKASAVVGSAIVEKVLKLNPENQKLMLFPLIPDASERIFISPIGSTVVSSVFNLARRHPVKRRIQPHNGIDFRSKKGTPVFPALKGKVVAMGRGRAKGKYVLIEHENGMQSTYDHLSKFQKGLKVGMSVDTKKQIGLVGRTGYATGAHLHFGLIKNGHYVNPLYYLKDYQLAEDLNPNQSVNSELDEFDDADL